MSIFLEFNRLITETTERLIVPKGKVIVLVNPSLNSLMNAWEKSDHNLRGLSYRDGTTVWWPSGMATHDQVESRIPNYGKSKYAWYLGDGGEGRAMLFVSSNSNMSTGDGDMNRLTGGSKLLRTMAFSPKVVTEAMEYPLGEVVWVEPLSLGKPINPNPNVEKLKREILQSGKIVPLSVTPEGFTVDGAHRHRALIDLGVKKIPIWIGKQLGASGRLEQQYPGVMVDIEIPGRGQVTEAMTPAQAVKVFLTHGVDTRGMDKEAIRKARTRIALKGKVHPDRGGSTELAQELNAATDILMAQPQAAPEGFQDFKPKQADQGKPQSKQPGFEPFNPSQVYRDVKRGPRTGNVWKA